MPKLKLSEQSIAALPLPRKPKQVDYFDTETKGLSVRVSYAGMKVYQLHSGNVRVKLGKVGKRDEIDTISLKEARKRALVEKVKLQANKPTRVVRGSFKSLVEKYKQYALKNRWKSDATKRNQLGIIEREILPLGDWPISKITKDVLKDWLEGRAEKSASVAGVARNTMQSIFNWAFKEELIEKNPAKALENPYEKEGEDRILERGEIRELWRASEKLNPLPQAAFKLLWYTAQRKLLIERATWSGVNKETKTLRFLSKGKRSKNGSKRNIIIIPLSKAGFEVVLELEQYRVNDMLFPSSGKAFYVHSVVKQLIKATGIKGWSAHDIRRTVSDAMQGQLAIQYAVRKACLDQKAGDLEMYVTNPIAYMREAFEGVVDWINWNLSKVPWEQWKASKKAREKHAQERITEQFRRDTDNQAWDLED